MIIPLFIISKDRYTVLSKCIESYKKLGNRVKIVIHDNGSTYPPLLEYYKTLETQGIEIYYSESNNTMDDISSNVMKTISLWYENKEEFLAPYYIVTDPDVELETPTPELIDFYIKVLTTYPNAVCVGTMLRIDDIPGTFKFRDKMMESHQIQFWDKKINPRMELDGIVIQRAAIDTTFAMYRESFNFKRLNMGIRVHEPHMARHLDWYQDTDNLTEEEQYYRDHASKVSTLSNYNKQGYMG